MNRCLFRNFIAQVRGGVPREEHLEFFGDNEMLALYAAARERARWITPVPGGVGPMTIAVLLAQTADAAGAPAAESVPLGEQTVN